MGGRRQARHHAARWMAPLIGGLVGAAYGILDWGFLDRLQSPPVAWHLLDEFIDLVLPVAFGAAIGYGISLLRRRSRLIARLSVEQAQLQNQAVAMTLMSQLLHELRNPLHNLAAALEDIQAGLSEEQRQLLQRNLDRLAKVSAQCSRWGAMPDQLDPTEPTELRPWLASFIEDHVARDLHRLGIRYTQDVAPVRLRLHAVLLEQILVAVYGNACEALSRVAAARQLRLVVRASLSPPDSVEVRLCNTGAFPDTVLQSQGREPAASDRGLGLGLLLCRRVLEMAHGDLALAQEDGEAVVVLRIPGEAA